MTNSFSIGHTGSDTLSLTQAVSMMKSNKERLGSALSASPSTSVSMQGPSLSYERKIRLQRYAENRARSCLGLVNESSHLLWKLNDTKQEIALFKPVKEWAGFLSAKAVVTANASFPHVLKSIYDVETSDKFKAFLRKVLGDLYLDAQVLETLSGTGKYTTPDSNSNNKMKDMYKQSSIKWWAIKSGLLTSKSCDFYVLEVQIQKHFSILAEQFAKFVRFTFTRLVYRHRR